MSYRKQAALRRIALTMVVLTPLTALAVLPSWLQHVRASSSFEAALYRLMKLPGADVFFPRPPTESVAELNKLPSSTALYSLRAHQEEEALDFPAAERDWKTFAAAGAANRIELANFYHRRLAVKPELDTLLSIATDPTPEPFVVPAQQQSWRAFERAITLTGQQSIDDVTTSGIYHAWMTRYSHQPTVYGRAFTWALEQHRYPDAETILAEYQRTLPEDQVFPIKAAALLALKRGSVEAETKALAVYDTAFQPLWPDDLVSSYFSLLESTHNLRRFIADANARLQRNPDDLNALGRIFLYDQHQAQGPSALAALETYRRSKEARNGAWTAVELDTLAQLSLRGKDPASAARYDFALHSQAGNLPDGRDAKSAGLANMIALLLSTPEESISLGAGNLSMYRDIATLDQGPGYWNGVLSLWLNGQYPGDRFAEEEKKAQPYFQRAKAAELLSVLDHESPAAPQRPALHAQLLQAYADYGDSAAVIREGASLLEGYPHGDSALRLSISMAMADAYARLSDTKSEFALYDRTLQDLGKRAQNMPLTLNAMGGAPANAAAHEEGDGQTSAKVPVSSSPAFALDTSAPTAEPHPEAMAYAQVLDRYIGRLTSAQQLPEALAVLRRELDRNPNDPRLYEKLANFLGQNNLSAQQEDVYRHAIARFPDTSWSDKLARFYLRAKRTQDFAALTRKVADTFEGTDLDEWFRRNTGGGAQLSLQLNLYAHQRFPHDIVFTENLLSAYASKPTADSVAAEKLLREAWWQTPDLTRRFFELLSRTGKLEVELASLKTIPPSPATLQESAEGELWSSHFEQSAPLYSQLSAAYPADVTIGEAASNLQRSLAWFDSQVETSHTAASVAIEQRLLQAQPGNVSRLARIGDILADHADDSATSLAPAAAYWRRMPSTAPGNRNAYIEAATVLWDYFQFDDALAMIATARDHFHDPAMYGYEAGAIAEGKRDYNLAVREYTAAALSGVTAESESRSRLLQLARRPSTRDLVDSATAGAAGTGSAQALELRLSVLKALKRTAEVAPLLTTALKSAKTADAAGAIVELARSNNAMAVHDQALARQADLTTDPVERLQLRYQLAGELEERKDIPGASRLVDNLYKENPLILGVVRSTVEFDWRVKRQPQAIAVLVAAAESARTAQPVLANALIAEAASKANEIGDAQQARGLAESLLQGEPYNAQYLSLAADSFVRANDGAGLQRFYLARLESLKAAPMSSDERKSRTALLRKGLIPALTRGHDYSGAVDQYIALLSAYPEDSALSHEAAVYAMSHDRKAQLVDFLTATTKASPRDSRFFVDLAQAQTVFGDLPAAVDAYTHVIAIRKDRIDIYTAKAEVEETLQRSDEAANDYQRLYILSYKDPQWMVAVARLRARQGRATDAADALKAAWLTGPKKLPRDFFKVASQLEEWNLLEQAASYAEQGRDAAGERFLAPDEALVATTDPATYARILTRLRRTGPLFATLNGALTAASISPSSPALIAQQARAQGIGSVTDADWRKRQAAARREAAQTNYNAVLVTIGTAVDAFYTPEERAAYGEQIAHAAAQATPKLLSERWIPAAHAAGLLQREADWRQQLLLAAGKASGEQLQPYVELETSRMRFAELGKTLESFLKLHSKVEGSAAREAADAFHNTGDVTSEIRVLRNVRQLDKALRERYLDLLVQHDPSSLVTLSGSGDAAVADDAANIAVQKASVAVATAAIVARARALPPVWSASTLGLTSLYFGNSNADASLRSVLATDATIGQLLATKPDTAKQLTGELWFYYAARDGQARLLSPALRDTAEELLPADLEYSSNATSYRNLAETYAEAGNTSSALVELDHVLELNTNDADAQDARATLLWTANRRSEAIAAWQTALGSLRIIEDRSAAPESFWTGFRRIGRHLRERELAAQLRPQMDDVLRVYIARNGNYRCAELMQAAFTSMPTPGQGADWMLSLASVALDPGAVLSGIDNAEWLPEQARETILLREVQLARTSVVPAAGSYDEGSQRALLAQESLVRLYAARHEDARALALFRSIHLTDNGKSGVLSKEIVLAARSGELDRTLADLRSQAARPDSPNLVTELQAAAKDLSAAEDWKQARILQEFIFDRAQTAYTPGISDYLALAEARIHTGDMPGALALLRSVAQLPGDRYANLDAAAALLEKSAHALEAVPFLKTLSSSVPWNLSYSVRLAEAEQLAGKSDSGVALVAVARNPLAPYDVRVRAAQDLSAAAQKPELGSAELALLAGRAIVPSSAERPLFFAARKAAATQTRDLAQGVTLLREAIAIRPDDPAVMLQLFRTQRSLRDQAGSTATLAALLKSPAGSAEDLLPKSILLDDRIRSDESTAGGNAPLPTLAVGMTTRDRAQLTLDIASTYADGGEDLSAIAYFRQYLHVAPTGEHTEDVRRRISALQAAQRLEAANAARRPHIHKTLDQATLVRSRLTVAPEEVPSAVKEEE